MSTVTTSRTRLRPGTVTLLVVGLYLSIVAVPRIIGSGGLVRIKLIFEALLFLAVLCGIGLLLLARGRFRFDRAYGGIFALFALFTLLSGVALVAGFARNYPIGDVLGDYFKFLVPVATVTLVYVVSDSSDQIEAAFAVVFRIALLLFAALLGLYLTGVLQPNTRPEFIYQFPVVLVLGYWLYRRGDPVARYGFPFLVVAALPFVVYSQSLSLLLQTVLTAVFTAVFIRADDTAVFLTRVCGLVVMGLVTAGLFILFATQIPTQQWAGYGYLGSKVVALVGDYTLYERLVIVGGSRAAEPFGVLAQIDDSFLELLFGSGMGSTFIVSSPFGSPVWIGEDHFVHAGLWEAVLRTGVIGGLTYLGILATYLYVGWHVSNDSYLGALVAANATSILVFTPVMGKFLGPQFFSYALFSYGLVRWLEMRAS